MEVREEGSLRPNVLSSVVPTKPLPIFRISEKFKHQALPHTLLVSMNVGVVDQQSEQPLAIPKPYSRRSNRSASVFAAHIAAAKSVPGDSKPGA